MDKVSTYSQVTKMGKIMIHDEVAHCFKIEGQGEIAYLLYEISDKSDSAKQVIDFKSTFVPNALRGKGIAEQLVRTGLSWAREQGFEIEASCWYVEKFLKRGK